MRYTDNPLADFEAWDAERAKWLERRPKCADCGEPIQDDHYYQINGGPVCQYCLDNYRVEINE